MEKARPRDEGKQPDAWDRRRARARRFVDPVFGIVYKSRPRGGVHGPQNIQQKHGGSRRRYGAFFVWHRASASAKAESRRDPAALGLSRLHRPVLPEGR